VAIAAAAAALPATPVIEYDTPGRQITRGAPPRPYASIWYRGGPGGVPRLDDLAVIRASGFPAVTWPAGETARRPEVERLAAEIGLEVITGHDEPALTPLTALRPSQEAHIRVGVGHGGVTALAWRALMHGALGVSFDPGPTSGAGLNGDDGAPHAWVAEAAAIARQLMFNGQLIVDLVQGPDVIVVPPRPAGLDVVLRQTPRLWVLVATNTSAEPIHAVAQLPTGLPPALWVDLLDGTGMSMLNRQVGPQWTFDLGPGQARLYAIDKSAAAGRSWPVPSSSSP
jgi:hypothetical protein